MENILDISYTEEKDKVRVFIPSNLDASNQDLKNNLIDILKNVEKDVILDMKNTTFVDSTGISTIIFLFKFMKDDNKKLYISNAKGIVKESLQMSKIFKFVENI